MEYESRGLSPEHPGASATDDVEGMIGLMHDMLGNIFDVKQFLEAQPKILNEFSKRSPTLLLDRSERTLFRICIVIL